MLFDKDEDGVLTFQELNVVMKSLGQRPSGEQYYQSGSCWLAYSMNPMKTPIIKPHCTQKQKRKAKIFIMMLCSPFFMTFKTRVFLTISEKELLRMVREVSEDRIYDTIEFNEFLQMMSKQMRNYTQDSLRDAFRQAIFLIFYWIKRSLRYIGDFKKATCVTTF